MTTTIDSSLGDCAVSTGLGLFKGLKFRVQIGWKARKYAQKDIVSVTEIDTEQYRSAGGAAAGAIIGGVLTGGVGLLVGTAIGGRRRRQASYLIRFADGEYIAISEKDGNVIRVLDFIAQKARARDLAAQDRSGGNGTATS